jgi:lipopolysaccharide transport system permease protein
MNRGWGPASWRDMLEDLWRSRELGWIMFRRGLDSQHRGTLFGKLGLLIEPLLLVSPFIFLAVSGVLDTGLIDAPYPVYAMIGLAIFYFFREGVTQCGNAMIQHQNLIVKINFPKEVLVFSQLGQMLVNLGVRLALALVFVAYFAIADNWFPKWQTVLIPVALVPMAALALGVGFILAFLTALMRDVAKYVGMLMPFLLFTSPILYATPRIELYQFLMEYNPVAGLVIGPRDLVLYGYLTNPNQFWISTAVGIVVFLIGWRLFRIAEVRLAERLGAK